ncbi:MAG TPA: glycosyltransferase family 4 protein [Methylomirabilota bacterium]|nr:glycosyltransferase family 4 protein [Methylomirabilota bacterium]
MVLGLLPAIRGGLGELAKTGQHTRLIDAYLRPYARAFEEVLYFSYLAESLEAYETDRELGARVRLLPGGGWHPWAYGFVMPVRYSRELRRCSILRVFQVTGALPAVIAKRRFGTPFVTTYGFWYGRLARSRATRALRRVVETLGLRAADAVIVTTRELAAHVGARIGGAKVHLIPNGVDTALFAPAARGPRRRRNVLYVGRLSEEKNLGALVDAAAALAERFDLTLTFIGDGPSRSPLEAHARRLNVAAEFIPVVEHRRVPAHLADADAFVLPSFTEGHPKALLEAMSAGVPCVASNVGGNRAVLEHSVTGLLFELGDRAALAESLTRVLADPGLARTLGERARARVLECYDLARLVAEEIELLKRLARAG